jgi:hypothetical protein
MVSRFRSSQLVWGWGLLAFLFLGSSMPLLGSRQGLVLYAERVLPNVSGAVALRSRGESLYVLSRTDHSVLVFDRQLELVRRLGRIGQKPGELYNPTDFDLAPDGTVWIAERGNNRVSSFTIEGQYLKSFPSEAPLSVAALRNGTIAVVELFSKPLVKVFQTDGKLVREFTGFVPVEGASERQTDYFNRARIHELPDGDIALAYRYLIPPRLDLFGAAGALKKTLHPPLPPDSTLANEARARLLEHIRDGSYGGRHVLTDVAVQPGTGHLWIAPGTAGVTRFDPGTGSYQHVKLLGKDGVAYGVQAIHFVSRNTFYAIAGRFVLRVDVPASQR